MRYWVEVDKPEFAEFLMNMRLAAGLTHEELGEKVGLAAATLKRYEDPRKKSMPPDLFLFEMKIREICLPIIRAKRGVQ